jgi:sorting nexin-17
MCVSELIVVALLTVGQDPRLVTTDLFNGFLLSAQQETSCEKCQEVPLDVFLMNGYKVVLSVMTTERSDQVLEV